MSDMTKLTLSGRIQHFQQTRLIIHHPLLSITILNSRVVRLHKRCHGKLSLDDSTAEAVGSGPLRLTWTVNAVLPTPPSPNTVILNNIRGAGCDQCSSPPQFGRLWRIGLRRKGWEELGAYHDE